MFTDLFSLRLRIRTKLLEWEMSTNRNHKNLNKQTKFGVDKQQAVYVFRFVCGMYSKKKKKTNILLNNSLHITSYKTYVEQYTNVYS